MATLGQQLKAAREAKGASISDAGSATKTLTKIIGAMEADDFSVMPAPAYAKGFIRLYAEYLDLDPAPLVEEYMEKYGVDARPLIDDSSQLEQNSRLNAPVSVNLKNLAIHFPRFALPGKMGSLLSRITHGFRHAAGKGWHALPGNAWKDIRVLAGAVVVLVILTILISSLSNCSKRRATNKPVEKAPQVAPARILLDEPVPDIYLVEPGKIETN